jgi:hypothetical protein
MKRVADPYRDLDVIDSRGPRFNQAVVGTLSLVAFLTGWWWLLALLAAQLVVGLTLGRRWCLPCLLYFEVIQPRFGEGPIEDARPPRFANILGATVLGTAALALALGLSVVGWALSLLVAALALFAAAAALSMSVLSLGAGYLLARRRFPGLVPGLATAAVLFGLWYAVGALAP